MFYYDKDCVFCGIQDFMTKESSFSSKTDVMLSFATNFVLQKVFFKLVFYHKSLDVMIKVRNFDILYFYLTQKSMNVQEISKRSQGDDVVQVILEFDTSAHNSGSHTRHRPPGCKSLLLVRQIYSIFVRVILNFTIG